MLLAFIGFNLHAISCDQKIALFAIDWFTYVVGLFHFQKHWSLEVEGKDNIRGKLATFGSTSWEFFSFVSFVLIGGVSNHSSPTTGKAELPWYKRLEGGIQVKTSKYISSSLADSKFGEENNEAYVGVPLRSSSSNAYDDLIEKDLCRSPLIERNTVHTGFDVKISECFHCSNSKFLSVLMSAITKMLIGFSLLRFIFGSLVGIIHACQKDFWSRQVVSGRLSHNM